jgi:hypothetical protein
VVIIALAATPAFADEIYLRGGGQITGEIISQDEDSVTVDIGGGTITARMETVVRIEKSTSPLQEYRVRAAKIPAGDAEAWRELARWAKGHALSTQSREAYREVLEILPDDEEANQALGMVQLDGRWVTEEESYRARGYVQFEGKWMTPAEKQAIIADRKAQRAQAEADRKANEARVREIEAQQNAEKKREDEERAKLDANRNTVYWGWGAGPAYWHRPVPRPWPENPASGGR